MDLGEIFTIYSLVLFLILVLSEEYGMYRPLSLSVVADVVGCQVIPDRQPPVLSSVCMYLPLLFFLLPTLCPPSPIKIDGRQLCLALAAKTRVIVYLHMCISQFHCALVLFGTRYVVPPLELFW